MPQSGDRHFSESEAAKIIRRALELQGADDAGGEGISREELLRVGREMGLSDAAISAAIDAEDESDGESQTRWLGAPPAYTLERVIAGTLTDEAWAAMVGRLNEAFKQSLEGVTSGPVRTWHWKHETGNVQFTATQERDGIRLKLTPYLDDALTMGLILTVVSFLVGGSFIWATDSLRPWLSLLLSVLLAISLSTALRRYVSQWYVRDQRKLNRLMDRLTTTAKEYAQSPLSSPLTHSEDAAEELQNRLGG